MKKWASMLTAMTLMVTMFASTESYATAGDYTRIVQPQNVPTVGRSHEQKGAVIVLREKEKDAWSKDEEFVFSLPAGVSWNFATQVNGQDAFTRDRVLIVHFNGTRDLDQIVLTPYINVRREVGLGDIHVSIDNGPISSQNAQFIVATVSDYGLLMNPQEPKDIMYGDKSPKVIKMKLDELIDESLIRSMPYELTLENASFVKKTMPSVRILSGNKRIKTEYVEDSMIISTEDQAKKSSWEIAFEIVPKEDYVGNITLNFKGRETDQKTVIASVKKDLDIKAEEVKNVSLGYMNEKVANLVITEEKEGVLPKGSYTLSVDPAYDTNKIESASLKVTDGNMEIGNIRYKDSQIMFDVMKESTKPSMIEVQDVTMSLSNAAYLGEYKVQFVKSDKDMTKFGEVVWFNATAPTGDPAQPTPERVAQFVIDKMEYNLFLRGMKEEKSFDVAPYIESGRTMMSVKAVADALDMDVAYDAKTKEIMISSKGKDAKVIKLTIGEKVVVVDEKPVPIDVAPVIKDSRTFVPVAYVGKFFDVKTDWDSKLKMITVTVK